MWNRWVLSWRLCMLAATTVFFVWFVMQSSQTSYLVAEVSMLFAVLFFGYRFGSGTGAVVGSICGLLMGFWTKELAQMGMFSVLGVFSGAFRRLGRAASATAYLTAAFGVGLLYSPALLFEFIIAVMLGGILFLLLPAKLIDLQPENRDFPVLEYRTMEGAAGEKLRQAQGACQMLSGYFADENLAEMIRERKEDRNWREYYLELRLLFSEQMTECAQMMEHIGQIVGESAGLPADLQKKLSSQLDSLGVDVERIVVARGDGRRGDLFLLMSSKTERCVTMKLVSEAVSQVLGRPMVLQQEQSAIVSRTPRMVRFQENPAFFMLHGVAQTKKEGSGFSGDSFSFLEPDCGQAVFFLCDGMGSGIRAQEESARVTELAEQLCRAGFSSQMIVRLINNALMVQGTERPVTVDMGHVDLYSGICDFTKSGACVSFISRADEVEELTGDSLPVGILRESAPVERMLKLGAGDMIIMMTDGVLEALPGMNKEEQMKAFCLEHRTQKPREYASRILSYAQSFGAARDDMTVLVAGIWKK